MCAACKTPSWSGGAGLATAHLTSRAREREPLVPGKRERRGRHPRPPERRRAPPKQPGALGGAPAPPAAGVRVHTGHAGAPQGEEGAGGVRFGPRGRRVPVARGSGGRSQTLVRGQHERRAGAGGLPNAEGGGRVAGRVAGRAAGDSERRAGAKPPRAPGFLPVVSTLRGLVTQQPRGCPWPRPTVRPTPAPAVSTLRGLFASSIATQLLCPRTQPPTTLLSPARMAPPGPALQIAPSTGARPGTAPAALAPRPAPGAASVFSSVHRDADFADSGSAGCSPPCSQRGEQCSARSGQ